MNILQVKGLSKFYGSQAALSGVDLAVPKGTVFGLLGPNGAGKTTLIRIINQIIDADKGEILIRDEPLSPRHVREVGYLPEERGLYKRMKVGEQLLYFAQLKGLKAQVARQKVAYWLERLDIAAWKDKKIEDLSKGMAQKVQFVATVIHEPQILILDEPFSGFDPVNADIIKNEILSLKEKGVTVILSTHRMESVELLCDHIAMLNKSEKVLDGPVAEIKAASRTNKFLIKLRKNVDELPFECVTTKEEGRLSVFELSLDGRRANELLSELMNYGEVVGFEEIIPTIEEIFIQKIKDNNHE